jgi:hypothetical protein
MNLIRHNAKKLIAAIFLLVTCSSLLVACGGSGSDSDTTAGIGGTGVTAKGYVQGKVTGFGSIYVNGAKFNTDASSFTVDGNPGASQIDLAVGMVVTLEVETENGNYTGNALKVVYDDEVQGPVSDLPSLVVGETQRTFKVFGQTITIDDTSTLYKGALLNPGFGFDTIKDNDVVEISGFRTSADAISATYVEWKEPLVDGSIVELRGTIGGYTPPTEQFNLDGFQINFDSLTTDIDTPNGKLSEGMYVEVKGSYQIGPPVRIDADKIEFEDEEFGDEIDDISLQGIISKFNGNDDFEIDGLPVDASGATKLSPANVLDLLDDGVEIEVEGDIVGGVLMADELELREGETRLKSFVSFVFPDNKRFLVNFPGLPDSIEVTTNNQTLFDDEGPLELEDFSVADMAAGDFVSVEGAESNDKVTAETVKRLDKTDPDDSELEGQVDSFVVDASITVLGISYSVNGAKFEDSSGPILSGDFFLNLKNGDRVEIRDEVVADGFAEEVKLDD